MSEGQIKHHCPVLFQSKTLFPSVTYITKHSDYHIDDVVTVI